MRTTLLWACAALLILSPGAARADEAGPVVFDSSKVVEIHFTLSEVSLDALRVEPGEYVEGDLTVDDGEEVRALGPIGVRLKGNSSFQPIDEKPALKLKFNEFVSGQRFLGLKGMTLNNMTQDPSRIRETLAYEMFRAAGLHAPRTGLAYVRLNGEGLGLYAHVEQLDDVWADQFAPDWQHIYEGEGVDATPGSAGDFKIDEGDEEDISDLEALIADPIAHADLEQMTRFWAVEHYIGHWDGYSVDDGSYPNNYFLLSDTVGRFSMMPWGTDQTFQPYPDPDGFRPFRDLGFGNTQQGRLFSVCIADATCAQMYREQVAEVRALAISMDLPGRVDALEAVLSQWQPSGPGQDVEHPDRQVDFFFPSYVEQQQAQVRAFVSTRPQEAAAWLGITDPPPPPPPVPAPAPLPVPEAVITPPAPVVTPGRPAAVRRCRVPLLKGRTLGTARKRLRAAGCRLGTVKRIGKGRMRVASQSPGRSVWREGKTVRLTLRALPVRSRGR